LAYDGLMSLVVDFDVFLHFGNVVIFFKIGRVFNQVLVIIVKINIVIVIKLDDVFVIIIQFVDDGHHFFGLRRLGGLAARFEDRLHVDFGLALGADRGIFIQVVKARTATWARQLLSPFWFHHGLTPADH
jgi:hypothetical protein